MSINDNVEPYDGKAGTPNDFIAHVKNNDGPTNIIDNVGPSDGNTRTTKVSAGASNDHTHALTSKFFILFYPFSHLIYFLL